MNPLMRQVWSVAWGVCLLATPWEVRGQAEPRSLESIYPGVAELRKTTRDVICLLDVEHPGEVRKKIGKRPPRFHALERTRLCIELDAAGLPCLLTHAVLVRAEDLARPSVKAVVVCGRNRPLDPEDELRLRSLLRDCRTPTLCLNGGLGLLAAAWGGKSGPMRRLHNGEADPDPGYFPGVFKEVGFTRVDIQVPDPVFAGLGKSMEVLERHTWEVKEVPPGFEVLAGTEACRVQAIRHAQWLIYGLQFQPDGFDDQHGDGKRVLSNFFRLAGIDTASRLVESRAAYRAWARGLVHAVCQEPRALTTQSQPFIAAVILETPEVVASSRRSSSSGQTPAEKIAQLRHRIQGELAGLPCIVVHYIEVLQEHFASPHLRAIVITGAGNPTADPMTRDLFAVIRQARVPILGLCAGHQHIGEAHGAKIGSLRSLREGEPDPNPAYFPGMFKEWGFLPVTLTRTDPLFEGLDDSILVQERHMAEVKSVPEGFDLLASSENCAVQAMKQRGKPVYGTQFHPESYDNEHPDGRRLLQNFFRIAKEAASSPAP